MNSKLLLTIKPKWRATLLLDFDTFDAYREFPRRARFVLNQFGQSQRRFRVKRFRSHSGKWHVVVLMYSRRLPPPIAIAALQAILGSDWKRETFNLVRARKLGRAPREWQHNGRWNTLYAEKLPWRGKSIQPIGSLLR